MIRPLTALLFSALFFAVLVLAPAAARAYEPNSGFGPSFTGEVPPALAGQASDAGPLWAIEPAAGDGAVEGSVTVPAQMLGRDYSAEVQAQDTGPRIVRIPAEKLRHKIDPKTLGLSK